MWGFTPVEFESLEGLIGLIAKAKNLGQRIRVISHAWDGFNIPLFNGSPAGFTITQRQIEAVNAGDGALMDALLGKLVDLDATTNQGQTVWTALLVHLESSAPDALKPFGLSSGTKPTGDRELLLRRCADLVAVASADPAFKNAVRKSIAAAVARLQRTKPEVNALETAVASSGFTFTMSAATSDMVKRLRAAVDALDRRAFRKTLKDARAKLAGTWLDFRGCRIGHQPTYLEALAKLMGTDGCTAPDWWSGYPGEVPLARPAGRIRRRLQEYRQGLDCRRGSDESLGNASNNRMEWSRRRRPARALLQRCPGEGRSLSRLRGRLFGRDAETETHALLEQRQKQRAVARGHVGSGAEKAGAGHCPCMEGQDAANGHAWRSISRRRMAQERIRR